MSRRWALILSVCIILVPRYFFRLITLDTDAGPAINLPLCDTLHSNDYTRGRWVQSAKLSATTASVDLGNKTAFLHSQGYLSSVTTAGWDSLSFDRCYHSNISRDLPERFNSMLSSLLDYNWVPDTCHLADFDLVDMQRILADKKVAFVGDSMTDQFHNAFWAKTSIKPELKVSWNLVHPHNITVLTPDDIANCKCFRENIEKGKAKDAAGNDCKLHPTFESALCNTTQVSAFGSGWTDVLPDTDVLILNTGAHLVELAWHTDKTIEAAVREQAAKVADYLDKHFAGKLIVWVNQPVFNGKCNLARKPLRSEEYVVTSQWYWDQIVVAVDGVWPRAFQQSPRLKNKVVYLDVDMTNLRADQHPPYPGGVITYEDCLHYCQPGPNDLWVQILYNILKQYFI